MAKGRALGFRPGRGGGGGGVCRNRRRWICRVMSAHASRNIRLCKSVLGEMHNLRPLWSLAAVCCRQCHAMDFLSARQGSDPRPSPPRRAPGVNCLLKCLIDTIHVIASSKG